MILYQLKQRRCLWASGLVPAEGRSRRRLASHAGSQTSADLPNADCPQGASTWYLPGKSPIRISSLHRRVLIDLNLPRSTRISQPVAICLRAEGHRGKLFWFANEALLGEANAGDGLAWQLAVTRVTMRTGSVASPGFVNEKPGSASASA